MRDESQPRAASYLLPSPHELALGLVMTFREGKEKFGKRRGGKKSLFDTGQVSLSVKRSFPVTDVKIKA